MKNTHLTKTGRSILLLKMEIENTDSQDIFGEMYFYKQINKTIDRMGLMNQGKKNLLKTV